MNLFAKTASSRCRPTMGTFCFRSVLAGSVFWTLSVVICGLVFVSACATETEPDSTAETAQAVTAGSGSCIGEDACLGVRGHIGANSCNGPQACMFMEDVGDNS